MGLFDFNRKRSDVNQAPTSQVPPSFANQTPLSTPASEISPPQIFPPLGSQSQVPTNELIPPQSPDHFSAPPKQTFQPSSQSSPQTPQDVTINPFVSSQSDQFTPSQNDQLNIAPVDTTPPVETHDFSTPDFSEEDFSPHIPQEPAQNTFEEEIPLPDATNVAESAPDTSSVFDMSGEPAEETSLPSEEVDDFPQPPSHPLVEDFSYEEDSYVSEQSDVSNEIEPPETRVFVRRNNKTEVFVEKESYKWSLLSLAEIEGDIRKATDHLERVLDDEAIVSAKMSEWHDIMDMIQAQLISVDSKVFDMGDTND